MRQKNNSEVKPELSNRDELSTDDLISAAYPELKRMARRQLRKESGGLTTKLLNFIKL